MKRRLQAKYAGVIVGLIIVVAGALSGILLIRFDTSIDILSERSAGTMSARLMTQMEKRAEAMVRFLSGSLTNPLYQYNVQAIQELLRTATAQKDVVNAQVYDPDGLIVHDAIHESANFGEPLGDPLTAQAVATAGTLVKQVEGDVLSVSLPIFIGDTPLGGVKLTLSLDSIRRDIAANRADLDALGQSRLASNTWAVIVSMMALIIVAILLGVTVSGRMIKPIRELTENVARVGQGDYRLRIATDREDELGDLIRSFNSMTEALEDTTVSKNYVENIIGSMTDMMAVLNADGSIRMVNRAMNDLLDYDPDELVGQGFSRLLPAASLQDAESWLAKLVELGVLRQYDHVFETKQGAQVPVSLSGSVMTDRNGAPEAIVCLAQDITERKRAQEAMIEAKHKAEDASRAKSEFLAAMSHEIRTPMNGVLGMTDLLLRTKMTTRQRRYVGIVNQSAETLLSIINDILDFSRIEAGKLQLDRTPFGLRETVGDTVELLAESAQGRGLELAYSIADGAPDRLEGDPSRLRQILINLIGNAIKFTERGEVVLRVTSAQADGTSVQLHFEVHDTGVGIAQDAQDRLFEAFEQVDGSISRRYGGTGLGLSIAKQLVELMAGDIWVESEPDAGSVFHFTVRLDRTEAQEPAAVEVELQGRRVLIVDDNATNREILEQSLSSWDVEVGSAADGQKALAMIRRANDASRPYDAAVLDMKMDGMGGLELARAIKDDPKIAPLRLMILTSIAWQDDRNEARQAGVLTLATKPVRPKVFREQLVRLLGTQGELITAAMTPSGRERPCQRDDSDSAKAPESLGHRARVLLAEDNPVNREVAISHLDVLECEVDTVENGRQAVAAAGRGRYDLILMDCQMPELDGLAATRAIRRNEAEQNLRPVPIIALTANALDSDRAACFSAGMDDFLLKPLKSSVLAEMLARWLPVSGAPGAAHRLGEASPQPGAAQADSDAPEPSDHLLDSSALDAILGLERNGKAGILKKVIELYLENAPQLIEDLQQALEAGDSSASRLAAHSLKSSSANLGALRVVQHARTLEQLCRDDVLDLRASEEVEALRCAFHETAPLLRRQGDGAKD